MRSNDELSIEEIIRFYDIMKQSILFFKSSILKGTVNPIPEHLIGLTPHELDTVFDVDLRELEQTSSFNLLAATEASLKIDFDERVSARWKDSLTEEFIRLYRLKKEKISIEQDILPAWKEYVPEKKRVFSELQGAFKYRHWVAHGRYWAPDLPWLSADIGTILGICQAVDDEIRNAP